MACLLPQPLSHVALVVLYVVVVVLIVVLLVLVVSRYQYWVNNVRKSKVRLWRGRVEACHLRYIPRERLESVFALYN